MIEPQPSVAAHEATAVCAQSSSWDDMERKYSPGLIAQVRGLAARQLPAIGREFVRQAAHAPSRRTRSTAKSSAGAYPSTKMGATIEFESRTLELAMVTTFEHDESVVAYFNQPPSVSVKYKRDGRTRSYHQTPDFLRVRGHAFTLIECKALAQITARNKRDPGFYVQEGDRWLCPALQEAASTLGMTHEVWTETSFSATRLRNLRMVGDYMGRGSDIEGYDNAREALQAWLASKARATISDALEALREDVTIDHLYAAIARSDIVFDMGVAPLVEPHRCFLYRDARTMKAFELTEISQAVASRCIVGSDSQVREGTLVDWDGATWRCANFGRTEVLLCRGECHQPMPRTVFLDLIRRGTICVTPAQLVDDRQDEVYTRIAQASEKDLRVANLRHVRIAPYLVPGARAPASRTERRYLAAYRQAQAAFGNGYIGLIPSYAKSRIREARLSASVLNIAHEYIREHYLNATNKNKKAVFTLVVDACAKASLPPPCYAWFCRFVDRLPAYEARRARKGDKGAYRLEPRVDASDIDNFEPERPMERAHIDHTLIDVETIFGETSEPLGKCWLTLMIDHNSRRCLAHYLTYDPPSHRSVLMAIRNCVKRHGRLPESIVVDGGKEFSSTYFDTTCAIYKVKIIRRPITKPRFGSQIERFFGTCNTNFFHLLSGNTTLRKNVRELTEEVNPSRSAIWTLPALNKKLSRYLYEVYETLEHRELLVAPRFAFERGMERHGDRPERFIAYNDLFLITTSPAPAKGTAKVQPDGVKIHYLYYYSAELLRHVGKVLNVRYDPFDKSVAWAYADGCWIRLRSRHHRLLSGYTQHDLELATEEWRKRRSVVEKVRLSEPVLVKFLKDILETETLLLARKRAVEERRAREAEEDDFDCSDDRRDDDTQIGPTPPAEPALAESSPRVRLAAVEGDIELLETF